MRDTGIADRLRAAGLRVLEVAGWQTRGADTLAPQGGVMHHTAGPRTGTMPSLGILINGKLGVPGPLCNVAQSREPDGNDIFYVIAAGKANHAGEGSWHGISGNSHVFGLEIEHTGLEPLPDHRQQLAARCFAALFKPYGISASMLCQHREWAPGRKVDAATRVNPDQVRAWCTVAGTPAPPPSEVHEVTVITHELGPGGDIRIGLPAARSSAVATFFCDGGSAEIDGWQIEKGKVNGLFSGGADTRISIPNVQGFDVPIPNNQLMLHVKHVSGTGTVTITVRITE